MVKGVGCRVQLWDLVGHAEGGISRLDDKACDDTASNKDVTGCEERIVTGGKGGLDRGRDSRVQVDLWSWCVFERVPLWDNAFAPLEDYPLAGFCCDPLYWGAIM